MSAGTFIIRIASQFEIAAGEAAVYHTFWQVWDRRPLYCTAVPGEAPWVAALNPGEQDTSALRPPTPPHREAGTHGRLTAPASRPSLRLVMKRDLQRCLGACTFTACQQADTPSGSSATAPPQALGKLQLIMHTHSERRCGFRSAYLRFAGTDDVYHFHVQPKTRACTYTLPYPSTPFLADTYRMFSGNVSCSLVVPSRDYLQVDDLQRKAVNGAAP